MNKYEFGQILVILLSILATLSYILGSMDSKVYWITISSGFVASILIPQFYGQELNKEGVDYIWKKKGI